MEFTYIKKNVKGYYVTFPSQFIDELYNNIGSTYEDFLDNKWVLLTAEQLAFKESNPEASVEEVFNMALNPEPERTLEQAKSEKLAEISTYSMQAKRAVSYEGTDVYVDSYQRMLVKDEAEVAQANNVDEIEVASNVMMSPSNAISLMSVMTERDNEVDAVREGKVAAVNSMEDIESVDSFDAQSDYPTKAETTAASLAKKQETEANNLPDKQVLRLMSMKINTMELTDSEALSVKMLYPEWSTFIGSSLKQGMRVLYEKRLYNVRQDVSVVLEDQFPSINTAALYEEINEENAGTLEDPIPYNNNMELEMGKYYSQDGVIYLCTRGTGQAVYNPLKDLVGIYVEVAG